VVAECSGPQRSRPRAPCPGLASSLDPSALVRALTCPGPDGPPQRCCRTVLAEPTPEMGGGAPPRCSTTDPGWQPGPGPGSGSPAGRWTPPAAHHDIKSTGGHTACLPSGHTAPTQQRPRPDNAPNPVRASREAVQGGSAEGTHLARIQQLSGEVLGALATELL